MGGIGKQKSTHTIKLDGRGSIEIDEPLRYGADSGRGELPKSVRDFEEKRKSSKIEYSILTMANGDVVEENMGGRRSVGASYYARNSADVLSHIHPRSADSGSLGGTFSTGDINNFLQYNQTTYRAVASEGVYSITKGEALKADAGMRSAFRHAYEAQHREFMRAHSAISRDIQIRYDDRIREIRGQAREGRISSSERDSLMEGAYRQAVSENARAFNNGVARLHQWLIDKQAIYGYTYGLERW